MTGLTWLIAIRSHSPVFIRRLLATSAIVSLLVLALTTQAAPLMWRVGSAPADPVLLAGLLDRFTAWTIARVVCVDLSFGAMLTALTKVALPRSEPA